MEPLSEMTFNTKRKLLIVEDNELNREILSAILEEEYDVLTAENGQEGLDILSVRYREISLVLLDVYMPVLNGFEFLQRMQKDSLISGIPVIVTTGSDKQEDEIRCLNLGASDFVTKPYNNEVVLGRVRSIIKLKESIAALSVVEYDELTGLYTMPAFGHHVQELLRSDADSDFSLAVLNISEFKIVNSLFGEHRGDEVLRFTGHLIQKNLPFALIARQGDKFFAFLKHDKTTDFTGMVKEFSKEMKNSPVPNLKFKIGVYSDIDRSLSVSILCDHAELAAASIKGDYTADLAYYDDSIQKRILENQSMEADFERALMQDEFIPWFQPKVDVHSEKIVGAEALVRWRKSDGTLIPPGKFVPLFENDGLICRLDEHLFHKIVEFQKRRVEAGKIVVPISVNLSRSSIYESGIVERYDAVVRNAGIDHSLVPIELTESAALESVQIKQLAENLRQKGFVLHMDDFGSGYSSLSSLTVMPFEVIKLDKSLTDQIGNRKGETVVSHMISIAQEMGMKVVAEGAEKREQVDFLRRCGCNMIQGYYYSPPRDREMFENMLDNSREAIILNLELEYQRLEERVTGEYILDGKNRDTLIKMADDMPYGFFIYRADKDEKLLYANPEMFRIFAVLQKRNSLSTLAALLRESYIRMNTGELNRVFLNRSAAAETLMIL